jgi:hypothetical protein
MASDPPVPLTPGSVVTQPGNNQEGSTDGSKPQLARWAIFAISCIVVIYYAATYGTKAYTEIRNQMAGHSDATAYTAAIITEMRVHENDKSGVRIPLHADPNSGDTFAVYYSDGCIAITRPGASPSAYLLPPSYNVEWSLAPSRRPAGKPPEPPQMIRTAEQRPNLNAPVLAGFLPHAGATPPTSSEKTFSVTSQAPAQQVQAGCLNPHPGNWQG